MKKIKCTLLFVLLLNVVFGQRDTTMKYEIGLDGYASVSSLGGSFGVGVKYAFVKDKKYAFGPSIRIQRAWSNNLGVKYGFNIYGAGAFFHYRLQNVFFVGAEFELLKSPINYSFIYSPKKLVPTCFIGGGFSKEFESTGFRLNAGVFYDIIDDFSSPFRPSYVLKNANGALIPVIYRVGLFFPLN